MCSEERLIGQVRNEYRNNKLKHIFAIVLYICRDICVSDTESGSRFHVGFMWQIFSITNNFNVKKIKESVLYKHFFFFFINPAQKQLSPI